MWPISGGRDIGALRVLWVLRVLLLLLRVWHFVRSTIGAMSTRVYLPWRVTWREAEEVVEG